ncbi:Rap1a/Tai family immunity protein [Rhizobium sp. RAF56]|uniref:Rap1a/Tai family immunity protein n=1 Tax=Rhizobium sp. RAF56 TaxID=3233062 RepID=UPI003F950B89
MRLIGVMLAGVLLAATAAHANTAYGIGEELTKNCRAYLSAVRSGWSIDPTTALAAGQCYGYVTAVYDAVDFDGEGGLTNATLPKACVPNINGNALTEVVANFVDQKPELRSKAAYFLVRLAFADKFPCK